MSDTNTSNIKNISFKPMLTEKSTRLTDEYNTYMFKVNKNYSKSELKSFFENKYNVKIYSINTSTTSAKTKRTAKGYVKGKPFKKVFIKLDKSQKIEMFSDKE